ncbi:potassium/proton antiporter [Hyphococcus sp.]|uniref:potassium/proton antiporter n=1 Tax=Hyphococcus sp. TaxID=2038636 RepID=UPI003D0D8DC2
MGAGLVALSTLTSLVSRRIGAPLLLVFLCIGLLAGEDGLLGIEFNSGGVAYFIGSLALAIILFDSGFDTPLRSYRIAAGPALTLATVGVVMTSGLVGVAAHYLFGIGWIEGMLLGSIISSTDAAAVFFLLRAGGVRLRERVKATLEVESGANDPMAIFLTTVFVELAAAQNSPGFGASYDFIAAFVQQIGLGLVMGAAGGVAIAMLLNRLRQLDSGLFPITGLASALVVFSLTGLLGGSGFLAAYVAGVVAGNRRLRYAHRIRRFQVGMTWLAQIGMFLTLGLLATPSEFGEIALPAIILALALIFFARPLAVWLCLLPFRFQRRETAFVGWVGLRGAVSIMLAILPVLGGVEDGRIFFNIVFMMVISSLLIQGWTIGLTARLLNMLAPPEPGIVDRMELELPGGAELELVRYRLDPESTVAQGERVPRWARPVLIMRDGRAYSIHSSGPLQAEDQVYLFASPRQIPALDSIYAKPSALNDSSLQGDFFFGGEARFADIARLYGLPPVEDAEMTVAEFVSRELRGHPVAGDRVPVGAVELVVNAVDDHGAVTRIGLVADPAETRIPELSRKAWDFIERIGEKLRALMPYRKAD